MITLYSTHCPKCKILKTKLDRAGVPHVEVNDIQVMLDMGITEAPMLMVDDVLMNFVAANAWVNQYKKEAKVD